MEKVHSLKCCINGINREINLYKGDMTEAKERFDLVMCSSFKGIYYPKNNTFICSLKEVGINVELLSYKPAYGSSNTGFWFSKEIESDLCKRICCVELAELNSNKETNVSGIFSVLGTSIGVDKDFHFKRIGTVSLGTGTIGLKKESIAPLMLDMMRESFRRNNELIEYSIFCLTDDRIEAFKNYLNTFIDKTFDVFISYSHKQRDLAIEIENQLIEIGLKVWRDDNHLKVGDAVYKTLTESIDKSKSVLSILSKDYEQSNYCKLEFKQSKELNKLIIPYNDENYYPEPDFLSNYIGDINWLKREKFSVTDLCKQIKEKIDLINSENFVTEAK